MRIKERPAMSKKRAIIYLRVSTRDQTTRGGEAEGFSIPAQREACHRKATALDAEVVAEFKDAGASAKSAERPDLKRMLDYLTGNPVDFVIVHKVDRLARNRMDDVQIHFAIRSAGATLVSCSENIDETPSGTLLHGVMSSIAEFYSQNLGAEAKKGMTQKAKSGGTPGRAPFGYLNVTRRDDEGREVRTVEVDGSALSGLSGSTSDTPQGSGPLACSVRNWRSRASQPWRGPSSLPDH